MIVILYDNDLLTFCFYYEAPPLVGFCSLSVVGSDREPPPVHPRTKLQNFEGKHFV